MADKLRLFIPGDEIEPQAWEQINRTASMPFVVGLAVMPDCHLGIGSTVGTVVATQRAVMPACVGVDIGCGMIAAQTDIAAANVEKTLAEKIAFGIERRIPMGIAQRGLNGDVHDDALSYVAELEKYDRIAKIDEMDHNWRRALGTLGGGNHFIELCTGTPDGALWATLHSGSRGVGNRIATFWIKRAKQIADRYHYAQWLSHPDLAYLSMGTDEFTDYIHDMLWAQRFALANREIMMSRVMTELRYSIGEFSERERINCHHNFSQFEMIDGTSHLITRKGAIEARVGMRAMIPGSMGDASYIVTGLGNAGSYFSAPHGAGRRMSRTAARKAFTVDSLRTHMAERGVTCRVRSEILDEHPGSYKDIDQVMKHAENLVAVTNTLRQFVNLKGD